MRLQRTILSILVTALTLVAGSHAFAEATPPPKRAAQVVKPKAALASVVEWEHLEESYFKFQMNAELFARDAKAAGAQDLGNLEGIANEAVLSRLLKAIYTTALEKKWTQTHGFRIFPMENLLSNSAKQIPVTFNPNGFRVAVFALRLGKTQRGVLLSSSFQSPNPGHLRELYIRNRISPMIKSGEADFASIAAEIVERLLSGDSRKSRHVQVTGNANSWVVGCETTVAGNFCVNASIFDSIDTDPSTFVAALSGDQDNENVAAIRAQNLAWPIEQTHISRGYKSCGCASRHFGLDLTAPVGTPVFSIGRGVVLHAKQFSGWGKTVVIEHELPNGSKYISLYAHLSKFRKDIRPGDIVERGALIAATGKSGSSAAGNSIPPHLHLEIRNAPEGKEPLQQPKGNADRPLDPLRVLDVFNVFVGTETLSRAAGEVIEYKK